MQTSASMPAIVSIGEALFDVFGQRQVLGGAPLNFAVHAHALLAHQHQSAAVVSRVGSDADGQRVIRELAERRLDPRWIQRDPDHPTGRSIVTTSDAGEPTYEIVQGVAWDFLEFNDDVTALAANAGLICFSTLAQRSPASRGTIEQFIGRASGIKLFDVNLRQQFYSKDLLASGLRSATHVKLNEEELQTIGRMFELGSADPLVQAERLIVEFDLQLIALTRGERGTLLRTVDRTIEGAAVRYPRNPQADNVGAGDACNAGLAVGLTLGWSLDRVVSLANHCGAFVASQPGATPVLPRSLLEEHGLTK